MIGSVTLESRGQLPFVPAGCITYPQFRRVADVVADKRDGAGLRFKIRTKVPSILYHFGYFEQVP